MTDEIAAKQQALDAFRNAAEGTLEYEYAWALAINFARRLGLESPVSDGDVVGLIEGNIRMLESTLDTSTVKGYS